MSVLIAFLLLCALYGLSSWYYSKEDKVYMAEAGCVNNASSCAGIKRMPSKTVRLTDGRLINTSDYIRIIIDGNCMTQRGVLRNEEWLVEPLQLRPNDSRIKPRDILLVYLSDKQIYKIREFVDYDESGNLNTCYYDENGQPKPSSKPHAKEAVCGVLRYAI